MFLEKSLITQISRYIKIKDFRTFFFTQSNKETVKKYMDWVYGYLVEKVKKVTVGAIDAKAGEPHCSIPGRSTVYD